MEAILKKPQHINQEEKLRGEISKKINGIKNRIFEKKLDNIYTDFFVISKEYFSRLLHMEYQFTYEEFVHEIRHMEEKINMLYEDYNKIQSRINKNLIREREKELQAQSKKARKTLDFYKNVSKVLSENDLREKIVVYCDKISLLEFGDRVVSIGELKRLIIEFEEIFRLAVFEKSRREGIKEELTHIFEGLFKKKQKKINLINEGLVKSKGRKSKSSDESSVVMEPPPASKNDPKDVLTSLHKDYEDVKIRVMAAKAKNKDTSVLEFQLSFIPIDLKMIQITNDPEITDRIRIRLDNIKAKLNNIK